LKKSWIEYPKHWALQSTNILKVPLPPNTAEYNDIAVLFSKTMQAKIIKITRIQNKLLYDKFLVAQERLKQKGSQSNYTLLFHGTSKTPPKEIYRSEDGIDMRFSNEGMWGKGCYFSTISKYSCDNYAYQKKNGICKIFVGFVLLGDMVELKQDKSLRVPPAKPSSTKEEKILYDSVKGFTALTQVHITYSNELSYPAYIISYNK